ncbi:hypothetical protein, partial [Enterococcus casseliflavus]|uniref:hypothetical protein n=1 Tax=Enterococcus casseliflavus TaxID=37734 RepID=UPI003D13F58F
KARFPAADKPGDAAWEGMTAADRAAVNRVFAIVGKAMAAFQRTLRVPADPLDAYVAGDTSALSEAQKTGLHHFFAAGCAQ